MQDNGYTQFEIESIRNTAYRQAYSDYLQSLHWDYYLTVTFRRPWRDGIKAHEAVAQCLHQECLVKRSFLAVERHRRPGVDVHVHGLVSDYDGPWRAGMVLPWVMWERLFRRFGRTQVNMVRSAEDVTSYCAKYVVKGMSDYGFYGSPTMWQK